MSASVAARAASAACSTSTSTSFSRAATTARSQRASSSSSSSPSPRSLSRYSNAPNYYLTGEKTSRSLHRTVPLALPEAADALSSLAVSLPPVSAFADALALSSSPSTPTLETASSLAASIARYASAAMLTLAELTNEATTAVAAEETRVVSSLAEVVAGVPSPSPMTTSSLDLLASLPASVFDPPHPEPANALSLPTWAIHVSSVAEWVVAMNLFWQLGGVKGGVPQWRGMSWGMTPLLGGALCACTFHFFYNSPALAPLVALQAGLTVVGNATMWIAAWRVFEATKEKREREDKERKMKEEQQA